MPFTIRGVHPVKASQPCYLIVAELPDFRRWDWGAVTQEDTTQSRSNWQVAYDERPISSDKTRWAFFFHYLDLNQPLLTPEGPVPLPQPTPMPAHLSDIKYSEP